jgi:hypothetical protein
MNVSRAKRFLLNKGTPPLLNQIGGIDEKFGAPSAQNNETAFFTPDPARRFQEMWRAGLTI